MGVRAQGANSISVQRTATTAPSRAGRDTVGRHGRSGSAPTRPLQETTDGAGEEVTSAASTTSPPSNLQSPSRNAARIAQQGSRRDIHESDLNLISKLNLAAELNANLKEHIRYAEAELESTFRQRDALQTMLTECERREQSRNGELVQAKANIQHLEKCLDDCKERIFKMQPLEHLTDSEIAEQYRTLCESISDWTDSQFGDYDNPLSMLEACFGTETPAQLVHEYLVRDGMMEVAKKYPNAACHIITYLIHRHVYQSVLREDLCFPGLDPKCEDFVSFIANAMKNNKPCRDEDVIALWLSEVQRTLSYSPHMQVVREKYLHKRCSELEEMLTILLPVEHKPTFRSQELRNIFEEAAILAKNIRLSPAAYQYQTRRNVGEPLFWGQMNGFKVIDQATSQLIRPSDTISANRDAMVGEMLCMIQPALMRKGQNGGRNILLVKAIILCRFDHPVVRRKKAKKVTGEALDSAAQHKTGDGGKA